MTLTEQNPAQNDAEIAERLVEFLEMGGAGPKASARKCERNTYFRRVELTLIAQLGRPRVIGFTRNLSTGGLGLLTRRGFNVGERFVTLLTLGGGIGKFALCRTTFCRYLSDGMCEIGAAFEATAPCLNANHRIPTEWLSAARTQTAPPSATSTAKAATPAKS